MLGTLLVILACLLWGVDTLIRYPLVDKGINPLTIVFYEHCFLALIFSSSLLFKMRKIGELKLVDVFSFFVIGGIGSAIATVTFTESFKYLNPSLVIILQKLQPIVAIILAAFILREKIQKQFLLWACVCLVGGLLVSSPDLLRFYSHLMRDFSSVSSDDALRGYGLVLFSICGWASTTVFGKRLSLAGFDTKDIMSGRFLTGLLILIPFIEWNKKTLFLPSSDDFLSILLMVIISGALAMWLYYLGLKRLSAKATAIAELFFPFFAVIMNWFFLGKELTTLQLLGGSILIIGSFIIQIKKY